MDKVIFRFGMILLLSPLTLWGATAQWEKISDEDGIEVFKKELPGSPIIAFKGQGLIEAPIGKVITVLMDDSRKKEWMDRLEESKRLRQPSETEYVEYTHVSTPVVLKDRDFVTLGKVVTDKQQKTWTVNFKSVDDPEAPKTNYVRGEIMESSFVLKSLNNGTQTYLVTEIHADPKGSVAKWIVNMFQKTWPRNTIEGIRKQVAKPGIKEAAY